MRLFTQPGPITVVVYLSLHGEVAYIFEVTAHPSIREISQMSGTHQVIRRVLVTVALLSIWHGGQAMAEPVRIAYADVFPPFTELRDGKAVGLAVEIVRAAAWHAGIEVEFVAAPFEQVQRTLEDGRAEAVFPLTITPERLPLFDFSDPFLVTLVARSSYDRRIARLKETRLSCR